MRQCNGLALFYRNIGALRKNIQTYKQCPRMSGYLTAETFAFQELFCIVHLAQRLQGSEDGSSFFQIILKYECQNTQKIGFAIRQ